MNPTLRKVLGLLLRLLIFAVTGEWPTRAEAEPEEVPRRPAPKAKAAAVPPVGRRAPREPAPAPVEGGPAEPSGLLADVETCLTVLAEPIVAHASASSIALPALRFVTGFDRGPVDDDVVFVGVSRRLRETPERWVLLARKVGRALFDAVPNWSTEIYAAQRLAPSLFLPPGHGAYDADTARAALGVWLPELFADVYAAYTLGPAYASALSASLARPAQPMETLMARAQGRWLAPAAPALVRMHAVLATLTRLGFHDWETELRSRWQTAHGQADSLYLPLADGRLMAIPLAFMLAELDEVLAMLLDEPQAALADTAWLDVPGFAYLHAEHAQAQEAALTLSRGEGVDAGPRILMAAAVHALDANVGARAAVAGALARSLRGAGTLEAAPGAYDGSSAAARAAGPRSLASAFRDPRLVREALLVGAALAQPRRRTSRL